MRHVRNIYQPNPTTHPPISHPPNPPIHPSNHRPILPPTIHPNIQPSSTTAAAHYAPDHSTTDPTTTSHPHLTPTDPDDQRTPRHRSTWPPTTSRTLRHPPIALHDTPLPTPPSLCYDNATQRTHSTLPPVTRPTEYFQLLGRLLNARQRLGVPARRNNSTKVGGSPRPLFCRCSQTQIAHAEMLTAAVAAELLRRLGAICPIQSGSGVSPLSGIQPTAKQRRDAAATLIRQPALLCG